MNDFDNIVKRMTATRLEPGDYTGRDGLLYCGKCRTPRQFRMDRPPLEGRLLPCLCQCEQERIDRETAEQEAKRHCQAVADMKRRGFTDPAMCDWTFANDNGKCPQMKHAHFYVENWDTMLAENIGYLLWGGVGTGKSYFAGCIANALMEKEIAVRMTNFALILNDLTASFEGRNEYISQLCRALLLILFHGLVYCATCGKSMEVRYEKVGRTDVDRSTKKKREPIDKAYYICQTYNRLGKKACTSHKIEARDLYNLMLSDIMAHAEQALQDKEGFYKRLTYRLEQQYTSDEGVLKKELDALSKRNQEIDVMFMSLYADKTKGVLTEQRFLRMTETLEQEQEVNKFRIQDITDELRTASTVENDVRRFIEEIQGYVSITELDEVILNRLIDKIIVSAVEVIDGEKVQKVRIVYNYVGEIIER